MSIKLSLICPVYKVKQYIPELMQSLLNGVNSQQVEVIFIDDCCPENSIAECEFFLQTYKADIKFNSIVIKQTENKGQAAARNVAFRVANGEYIGFVDSDDAISPCYWKTLQSYVEESQYDIIEFAFEEFTEQLPNSELTEVSDTLPCSNLNPFYTGFFVWTRLYKADLVAELTFPEGKVYEDIAYNIYAFSSAKNIVQIDASLLYYRKRQGSTTTVRNASYSNLLLNMLESVKATIKEFEQPQLVVAQVARYSLLVSLKGYSVKGKGERRLFFKQCRDINHSFAPLFKQFNQSMKASIKFKLSQFICAVGRFL